MIAFSNMRKMPKSCDECPFGGCGCKILGDEKRVYLTYSTTRRTDCPLVEVKPDSEIDILKEILMSFCETVGLSDIYNHGLWNYKFEDSVAGTNTKHDLSSTIIIEFTNGDVITYKRGEV